MSTEHFLHGHHNPHDGLGFDTDGRPEPSYETDFAREADITHKWLEPGELSVGELAEDAPKNLKFAVAADMLGPILRWFCKSRSAAAAGTKAFVLVLLLKPELLSAVKQTHLAESLGMTKQNISKTVRELFQMANGRFVRGRNCTDGETREKQRRAQLKRREREKIQDQEEEQQHDYDEESDE